MRKKCNPYILSQVDSEKPLERTELVLYPRDIILNALLTILLKNDFSLVKDLVNLIEDGKAI